MGLKPKFLPGIVIFAGIYLLMPNSASADTNYAFSCPESSIKGAIPYSVIGVYRSRYKECFGEVEYDNLHNRIKSVEISIKTASIESNCKWCDDIVRSNKVLNVAVYPSITFKSLNFENKGGDPWVVGTFELHGVTKNLKSPFNFKEERDKSLTLSGTWKFNRKDFNIIWNRWLDHGGILVGDYITVDWQVKAHKI